MSSPPPLLPLRRVLLFLVLFLAVAALAHEIAVWVQRLSPTPFGIGRWFPVSYGYPRTPSIAQLLLAVLSGVAFGGAVRFLPHVPRKSLYAVTASLGFLSILATTAVQGVERGFVHPIAGRDPHAKPAQYWHDAQRNIRSASDAPRLVREYRTIQPTLAEHGRTHPPGAVLLFALLRQLSGDRPALAAVLICALSVFLVALGFRLAGAPPFALLLFCTLPAVQLYFCATLDAVIAGLLFVAVVAVAGSPPTPNTGGAGREPGDIPSSVERATHPSPANLPAPPVLGVGGLLVAYLALLAASFLTFGVVWVVPVLFVGEIARTRRFPWRTAAILLAVGLSYVVLYWATSFNYVAAFRFASHNENPDGFRLFVNPVEYLATRVENIADLLFFAGPFALREGWRGLSVARRESFPAWALFLTGVGALVLLFLAGAYRTGETARACLFLYPLLTLVAGHAPLSGRDREAVLVATFGVSALLQCVGFYFW